MEDNLLEQSHPGFWECGNHLVVIGRYTKNRNAKRQTPIPVAVPTDRYQSAIDERVSDFAPTENCSRGDGVPKHRNQSSGEEITMG